MKKIIYLLFFVTLLLSTPIFADGHNADVAEIQTSIRILQQQVTNNGEKSTEILSTLRGRGDKQGLVTVVAVNCNSIASMQTWMLSISVFILGLLGWSIKMKLNKK